MVSLGLNSALMSKEISAISHGGSPAAPLDLLPLLRGAPEVPILLGSPHLCRVAGVVWCGVVWCGVVWCGVVWCGVVWCGVVWCGVVWCGVVWCGVVWCGVVWCGVVWCGVVCRRRCHQKAMAGMSTHGYR